MYVLSNDSTKYEVEIVSIVIIQSSNLISEAEHIKEDIINVCFEHGRKYYSRSENIVHVGKKAGLADPKKDYVIFVAMDSIIVSKKKIEPDRGYPCGSRLEIMWFDDDLNDIPKKAQKYLSQISWEDHAETIYS